MNGINGVYLRDIVQRAEAQTESVDAAVAYATTDDLLLNWCWANKIPLRFWGRFDEDIPVALPVLERFLARRSPLYTCKLVRCFHPKVIWWRGYGAYVGSANFTQSAWHNNVEAGVFFTEDELESSGQDQELIRLFAQIDAVASPLTEELMARLRARERELQRRWERDRDADQDFLKTNLVEPWEGLTQISGKDARTRARDAFLKEWLSTLQTLRDIAEQVAQDSHRPSWISPSAPKGAQADQFLHAHYYQRTFDGRRADYERHFEENRARPDKALSDAATWWSSWPEDSPEAHMLNVRAPTLRAFLSEDGLRRMDEGAFIEMLSGVHASVEYARRVPNAKVDLPSNRAYSIPEKLDAMGKTIWRSSAQRGTPVKEVLHHILHGGHVDDVPHRLWDALDDPTWKTEMLGVSSLGEIVGWALPDRYPPRNGRTSKALRSLGYDVTVHVGG
ncbi:MAG: phospholipase D family protein [Brevundimonas sp.]|uniref:phospholipase D family protein n=1 Tax=Brevundimonas sp. TaxID=1871086 RepID=UPI004034E541